MSTALPPLLRRVAFFGVGGLISFGLNLLAYQLLTAHFGWTHNPAYALSLTWVTLAMFFWNFRVNFPTPAAWHACAWRYLVATGVAWALNFATVGWIKHWTPVAAAIFVTGFLIALLKFFLYHTWVYPDRAPAP